MRNESFGLSSWVFYDVGCQTIFLSWKFSDVVFQSCDDWCKELVYGRSFCVFTAWCWSAMCCVVVGRAKLYFNSLCNDDCRNTQQQSDWIDYRLDTRLPLALMDQFLYRIRKLFLWFSLKYLISQFCKKNFDVLQTLTS